MSTSGATIFTKDDCPHCQRAKTILQKHGIAFEEIDVSSPNASIEARYYSGLATVPQIFIGDYHIESADDLQKLSDANRLQDIAGKSAAAKPFVGSVSSDMAADGQQEYSLSEYIGEYDQGRFEFDPVNVTLLHGYKNWFGYWPRTHRYFSHWGEAYRSLTPALILLPYTEVPRMIGVRAAMGAAFASTRTHGCNYCRSHTVSLGGEEATATMADLIGLMDGTIEKSDYYGEFELAVARLAANTTTNTVEPTMIQKVRDTAHLCLDGPKDPQEVLDSVGIAVSMMGWLNLFNDLVNVEMEGHWAKRTKDMLEFDEGRHAVTDENLDDLDHDIPPVTLPVEEIGKQMVERVGDLKEFAKSEMGFVPEWLEVYPAHAKIFYLYAYATIMSPRDHAKIASEFKHILVYVSSIAKGSFAIAGSEARAAHYVSKEKSKTLTRIKAAYDIAVDRLDGGSLFTSAEKAALRLAWMSAQVPVTTMKRFTDPLVTHYSPRELVELITVCGMAGSLQRVAAITKPNLNAETRNFLTENGLATDSLDAAYPV